MIQAICASGLEVALRSAEAVAGLFMSLLNKGARGEEPLLATLNVAQSR